MEQGNGCYECIYILFNCIYILPLCGFSKNKNIGRSNSYAKQWLTYFPNAATVKCF